MKAMFNGDRSTDHPDIIFPKDYEVVNVTQCEYHKNGYSVAEYPVSKKGQKQSITKRKFILISDIDETEMERDYKNETLTA